MLALIGIILLVTMPPVGIVVLIIAILREIGRDQQLEREDRKRAADEAYRRRQERENN